MGIELRQRTRSRLLSLLPGRAVRAHCKAARSLGRRLSIEILEGRCLLASLSGYVFDNSARNDGTRQAGDPGIAGYLVTLSGENELGESVSSTCETNSQGEYGFTNVQAGVYNLAADPPPAGYLAGKDTIGTAGGTVGTDRFSRIELAATTNATGYNFAELEPASLSGYVWDDTDNNNGVKESGEAGIPQSNVGLIGTDDRGQAVDLTAITGSQGAYSFANLRPGTIPLRTTCRPVTRTESRTSALWAERSAPIISAISWSTSATRARITTSAS